jgi:type II secretory ATPase GspE/PulE/Tfp pilus assembly ATPase PilB-like protein
LRRLVGESAWERLRFPDDLLLYRRSGCAECGGCGYHGRVGLHEVLVPSATLRSLVPRRASEAALLEQAIADGMITLAEDGLQKAAEGATDVAQLAAAVRA